MLHAHVESVVCGVIHPVAHTTGEFSTLHLFPVRAEQLLELRFGGPSGDSANFQKWRDNGNCLRALVPFRAMLQVLIELGEEGLVAVHLKKQPHTNAERVEVEYFELRFYSGNYSVRCCEPLVFNAAVVLGIILHTRIISYQVPGTVQICINTLRDYVRAPLLLLCCASWG